ncbi:hypothetical protein R9R78_001925 [Campylobacter coli]|nr:hypothetical protein [Campylobacter coli]ELT5465427.1 hypothetical protein [Campylobacter coli]
MKNKIFDFLFESFLLCILLLLMFGNFYISALIADWGIKLLNFIALEWFNEERFYVYARGIGIGLYLAGVVVISLFAMSLYSLVCYGLYNKYQGIQFFLIIFTIFIIYFFVLCLSFPSYRLANLLLNFSAFCLMYIEIILLYRIKNKYKARE